MKPDSYMPMYWLEFWQAVEGEEDYVIVAYQRAITHYWHHLHCSGFDQGDDRLRRICRLNPAQWGVAGGIIFGRFFKVEEDDKWHQKRCRELYLDVNERFQRRVKQTEAARSRRYV